MLIAEASMCECDRKTGVNDLCVWGMKTVRFYYTELRANLSIDLLNQYLGVTKRREAGSATP